MTIEEKARAYDEAVKKINDYYEGKTKMYSDIEQTLDLLFPELKKSEDERIRKALIEYFTTSDNNSYYAVCGVATKKILAWLEKQGKQKPIYFNANNWQVSKVDGKIHNIYHSGVEPKFHKFHEGDWVVCEITGLVYQIENCIENLSNHKYGYDLTNGVYIGSDDVNHYHLWTIQDAKDGDVLISENDYPFIYAGNHIYTKYLTAYCGITNDGEFKISDKTELWTNDNIEPATKEQRDLLFAKMREKGYEWDDVKKELKKIHVIDDGKAEGEQKLANSTKTCNDEDTLLSLLQQMPSCITVDGIDYHFVLKKTIAYMIFYEGEGEGSGKVIFWMAGEPVDICKEMLKRLEKEGLI